MGLKQEGKGFQMHICYKEVSPADLHRILDYCHRNTVIYRMKQIEELTGRSLHVPRDRLLMVLALMAVGRSSRGAAPLRG